MQIQSKLPFKPTFQHCFIFRELKDVVPLPKTGIGAVSGGKSSFGTGPIKPGVAVPHSSLGALENVSHGGLAPTSHLPSISEVKNIGMPDEEYEFQFGKHMKPGVKEKDYSPLGWEEFYDTKEMIDDKIPLYQAGDKGHIFFCVHGAGLSGLSFAALGKTLAKSEHRLVSFDIRGHGEHFSDDDNDQSEETLLNEIIHVISYVAKKYKNESINIVGHSMGGALATKAT